MRKFLAMAVLAVGCLGVMAPSCQPAETAMTITAKPSATRPECGGNEDVTGIVTPKAATSKVVLQRTVGGKWVDWKWREGNYDTTDGVLSATLLPGSGDSASYTVLFWANSTSTLHLRVRSSGGGYVSPGFYVTPKC